MYVLTYNIYIEVHCCNATKIRKGYAHTGCSIIRGLSLFSSISQFFFVRTPTTKSFHPAVEVVFSGVWDYDYRKNYKVDVPTTK